MKIIVPMFQPYWLRVPNPQPNPSHKSECVHLTKKGFNQTQTRRGSRNTLSHQTQKATFSTQSNPWVGQPEWGKTVPEDHFDLKNLIFWGGNTLSNFQTSELNSVN
jgi:hypothetical protein